jgi:hypothetical protein
MVLHAAKAGKVTNSLADLWRGSEEQLNPRFSDGQTRDSRDVSMSSSVRLAGSDGDVGQKEGRITRPRPREPRPTSCRVDFAGNSLDPFVIHISHPHHFESPSSSSFPVLFLRTSSPGRAPQPVVLFIQWRYAEDFGPEMRVDDPTFSGRDRSSRGRCLSRSFVWGDI